MSGRCSVTEQEMDVASLKRRIECLREEVAAWRDQFPGYEWHPQSKVFTYNGVLDYLYSDGADLD